MEKEIIDLFDLFSKDERDHLSQQICEKLSDKGLNPDDYEIIFVDYLLNNQKILTS